MFAQSTTSDIFTMAADLLRPVGVELVIFVVTLAVAFAFRRLSSKQAELEMKDKMLASPIQATREPKSKKASPELPKVKPRRPSNTSMTASKAVASPAERKAPFSATFESAGSREPHELLDEIVLTARDPSGTRNSSQVLRMYEDFLEMIAAEGLPLTKAARGGKNSAIDLYAALVYCVVRGNRCNLVERLLDDMGTQGVARPLPFYEGTMKVLAGAKKYKLALTVYDRLTDDGLKPSAVTLSCLINFSVEVGELHRAIHFFDCLSAATTPSIRAYMTVLRVHSMRQDWPSSLHTLRDMQRRGVVVDSLALNVALGTGILANKLEDVEMLISEASVADTVSYNTLAKGYAQRSDGENALKVLHKLRERGLRPNAITFNTVMDATVRAGQVTMAWRLLDDMRGVHLKPDKFTCSTLVKGLAKNPTVEYIRRSLDLIRQVSATCDKPFLANLFHSVFELCQAAEERKLAEEVFAEMRKHEVTPSSLAQRFMVQAISGSMAA